MDGQPIEQQIHNRMIGLGLRLATAESCTGGLIGHKITNVPGSSSYFLGGVVSYANQAKNRLLGVRQETLDRYGAVSRETVIEMAQGARNALEADVGIAVSGIAGPDGGTTEKPVGLVWVGLSYSGVDLARAFHFQGDRQHIKEQAAQTALNFLLDFLNTQAFKRRGAKMERDSIEVKARFDQQGGIIPQEFVWQERRFMVASVGRIWSEAGERHLLVMDPQAKVYELVFNPDEGRWYLIPPRPLMDLA